MEILAKLLVAVVEMEMVVVVVWEVVVVYVVGVSKRLVLSGRAKNERKKKSL
jgi:hypothetical protein